MKVIIDLSMEYVAILDSHNFDAVWEDNQIVVYIDPYNPIELQRLGLVLEQYQ